MKDRRIVLSAAVPALLLAAIMLGGTSASAAIRPQNFGTEAWAWAVARHPSSTNDTPVAKDQGNSGNGTNTVHRASTGDYTVTSGDLQTSNVVVHISALSTSPRLCQHGDYGQVGQDYLVEVMCRTRTGSMADTAFIINILSQYNLDDDMGYVLTHPPSFVLDASYSSANQANSVTKLGVGRWKVNLPGIGGPAGQGSVQVTGGGGTAAACRVVSWTAQIVVKVACRTASGALTDAAFSVTYMRGRGLKFAGDPNVAYVFADQPTKSSYSSTAGFRYSSAGQLPAITRAGVGIYAVKLPGMPLGGSAQVSAYGTGANRCVVSSIRTSALPQKIGVRCFAANGGPADTKFTLHYAR